MRELLVAAALIIGAQSAQVERDGAPLAHIWATCEPVATDGQREHRANFSSIRRNELLGTIRFVTEWRDYRGQSVPAGTYELRYAVQPLLKDHAGTTRWRDFAILTGANASPHPYVMALVPPDEGDVALQIGSMKIGLIVEGIGDLGM